MSQAPQVRLPPGFSPVLTSGTMPPIPGRPGLSTLPTIQPGISPLPTVRPGISTLPSISTLPNIQPGISPLPTVRPGLSTIQPGVSNVQPGLAPLPAVRPGMATLQPGLASVLPVGFKQINIPAIQSQIELPGMPTPLQAEIPENIQLNRHQEEEFAEVEQELNKLPSTLQGTISLPGRKYNTFNIEDTEDAILSEEDLMPVRCFDCAKVIKQLYIERELNRGTELCDVMNK